MGLRFIARRPRWSLDLLVVLAQGMPEPVVDGVQGLRHLGRAEGIREQSDSVEPFADTPHEAVVHRSRLALALQQRHEADDESDVL